jgi:hypothetical protein
VSVPQSESIQGHSFASYNLIGLAFASRSFKVTAAISYSIIVKLGLKTLADYQVSILKPERDYLKRKSIEGLGESQFEAMEGQLSAVPELSAAYLEFIYSCLPSFKGSDFSDACSDCLILAGLLLKD